MLSFGQGPEEMSVDFACNVLSLQEQKKWLQSCGKSEDVIVFFTL